MIIYTTFGQVHEHVINGQTFDRNCVAEVECESRAHGRLIAFACFGPKFFTTTEKLPDMSFFPRGIIKLRDEAGNVQPTHGPSGYDLLCEWRDKPGPGDY